jgi:predicted transcriptional regulator
MTKITIPIDKNMKAQLQAIAKAERRSLAFVMREAATIFLDRVSDTPYQNKAKPATKRKAA